MFIFFSLEVKIYYPFLPKSMKKWANVQILTTGGNKCPNQLILSGKKWSSLCLKNLLHHRNRIQTCNNLDCWGLEREKWWVQKELFSLLFINSLLCFEQVYPLSSRSCLRFKKLKRQALSPSATHCICQKWFEWSAHFLNEPPFLELKGIRCGLTRFAWWESLMLRGISPNPAAIFVG